MARPAAALAAAVALAAAGCGTYGASQEVRGTVRSYLGACAQGDGAALVPLLTPAGRRALTTSRDCAALLGLDSIAGARIAAIRTTGGRAQVALASGGRQATVTLSFGTGNWRIEAPRG